MINVMMINTIGADFYWTVFLVYVQKGEMGNTVQCKKEGRLGRLAGTEFLDTI